MKFLVDAQLPRLLVHWLNSQGHDAIHTLELPDANRTRDSEVCRIADRDQRVVVTKDLDFFETHLLQGSPTRLLLVSTGNLPNRELIKLFQANAGEIERLFLHASVLEISSHYLISH